MLSISSASSSTRNRSSVRSRVPLSRWSMIRPGVPTTMWTPRRSALQLHAVPLAAVDGQHVDAGQVGGVRARTPRRPAARARGWARAPVPAASSARGRGGTGSAARKPRSCRCRSARGRRRRGPRAASGSSLPGSARASRSRPSFSAFEHPRVEAEIGEGDRGGLCRLGGRLVGHEATVGLLGSQGLFVAHGGGGGGGGGALPADCACTPTPSGRRAARSARARRLPGSRPPVDRTRPRRRQPGWRAE